MVAPTAEPVRIVIDEMPDLLRLIVQDVIEDDPAMVVVAEASGAESLAQLVRETAPDVVIVELPDSDVPSAGRRLPDTTVVGITSDGQWLVLSSHGVSGDRLRGAVRFARRPEVAR